LRTIVYIDGFNLYYGACRAPGRRWLNPLALAQRLLPKDDIAEIDYFTANIKRDSEDPGAQDRQRLYHRALQTIPSLEIFLGRYISKRVRGALLDAAPDELSRRTVLTYEEKGTDVNLATRLLLDGFNRRYESAAVISNDGDLMMPIRVVREELGLHVTVVNPVLHSKHRSAALSPDPLPANASFIRLSGRDVAECQFPDQIVSPKGARLVKPEMW
jgi:uncharacterized LabA/DUF88 family protein